MEKDLHSKPETKVEHTDMMAITDPRQQKGLASNQGVRFYVERQLNSMEDALIRTMTDGFAAQAESLRQLSVQTEFLERSFEDLRSRMLFLECRWYERLMRYLEWDILSIRIWLYERLGFGSNPIPPTEEEMLKIHIENYEELKGILEPEQKIEKVQSQTILEMPE